METKEFTLIRELDRLHEINADHLADNTLLRNENRELVHALQCWLRQANGDGLDKKSLTRLVLQSELVLSLVIEKGK